MKPIRIVVEEFVLVGTVAFVVGQLPAAACPAQAKTPLRIGGSWSGFQVQSEIARAFEETNDVRADVVGADNLRGFAYLAADRFDVLIYSQRSVFSTKDLIHDSFGENKLRQPQEHLFGRYAVLVMVNRSNPVRHLTYQQLYKVFSGQVETWRGGQKIEPAGEAPRTKGYEIFRDEIMSGEYLGADIARFENCHQVAAFVARDRAAIGYCLSQQTPLKDVTIVKISKATEDPFSLPTQENRFFRLKRAPRRCRHGSGFLRHGDGVQR